MMKEGSCILMCERDFLEFLSELETNSKISFWD